MEYVGLSDRGNRLYVETNEVGGRRYWSDEIGGGVMVWDTSLVSLNSMAVVVSVEIAARLREERDALSPHNATASDEVASRDPR